DRWNRLSRLPFSCDLRHIQLDEPVLGSQHPIANGRVTARITTMTSFVRLSGLKAITICAALSMTAGLALAGENNVTKDDILGALYVKPQPLTRGLSAGAPQVDSATKAKEDTFLASIRNRKTRSLSLGEREEIAEIASTKPKIDLEINFDFN